MSGASYAVANTKTDIEVMVKAMGFVKNGPTGSVDLAVIYDPAIPESKQHADEVIAIVKNGVSGQKLSLSAYKVAVSNLSKQSEMPKDIAFVTRGLANRHKDILLMQTEKGIITLSNDEACLDESICVLMVKSEPAVDILISTAAAGRAGIEFATAFSMMVTKR